MQGKVEIIKNILAQLEASGGVPYRYDHFRQSEAVDPPFIVWRRVASDGTGADGSVYHYEPGIDIEIYAEDEESMADLMDKLRVLLDAVPIFYKITADTVYIESEDFYESLFEL